MTGVTTGVRTRLESILMAVQQGAGGAAEISRRTGFDLETVEAGLGALAATGRIRRSGVFTASCGSQVCGGCPLASGCASAAGSGLSAWQATRLN